MDFFGNFGKEIRRDTVVRRIFPKLGPLPVREASIPTIVRRRGNHKNRIFTKSKKNVFPKYEIFPNS